MKQLFDHSLARFLRARHVWIYLAAVLGVQLLAAIVMARVPAGAGMSLSARIDSFVSLYLIMSYTWTLGFPLAVLLGVSGGTLISGEQSDGTLLLLVSRPITRGRILAAKYLALCASSFMLTLVSLVATVSVYAAVMRADPDMVIEALKYVPLLALYSLPVIFVFSAVSAAFSAAFKGRIGPAVSTIALAALIFGIMPAARGILGVAAYAEHRIYLFDVNYQLGILFDRISGMVPSLEIPPEARALLGMFSGVYDARQNLYDYVRPAAAAAGLIIAGTLFLALAFRSFERKDVS